MSISIFELKRLKELAEESLPIITDREVILHAYEELSKDSESVFIEAPPFFLNQSRWKSYADCDRIYAWEQIEGIIPDRPRLPLAVGTVIHKAQVEIHKNGGTPEAIEEAVKNAIKQFEASMKTLGPQLPGDAEQVADGTSTIGRLLKAYHRHWKELGQQWKPLGQELSFCVEVGEGTKVFLVGTIDNLCVLNNSLWLVDYKTMAKLDMREFMKYEIDVQPTAYIYGGTKQLSLNAKAEGKPPVMIRGCIIDGMVKTTIPQFHREIYTRSMEDLRNFELEFCMKAWEIAAKHSIHKGDRAAYNIYRDKMYDLGRTSWKVLFPKNTQQCFRYGTCAYRDLCITDNEVRRMAYRKKEPDYVDKAREKAFKEMEHCVVDPSQTEGE